MDESSLRIGDAERVQARDLLNTHRAAGRLTDQEVDERMQAVSSARTRGDIDTIFEDLPGGFASIPTSSWPTLPAQPTGVSDGRPSVVEVPEREVEDEDIFVQTSRRRRAELERARASKEVASRGGFDWSVLVPVLMGVSILTMVFRGWPSGVGLLLVTMFIVAPLVGNGKGK